MKKIILIFLLFFGILISCAKEEDNIRFEISPTIEIRLEDFHEAYDFSSYVKAYHNDELIPYADLLIQIEDEATPTIGECNFIVIYKLKNKEYKESFKVEFKSSLISIKMHYGSKESFYELEKGKALVDLGLPSTFKTEFGEAMEIKGYYKDSSYFQPFDSFSPILNDLDIFAKLSFTFTFESPSIDANKISREMNEYILKLMSTTIGYRPSWNQEGFKGRWNYIDGVFLNSIVNLYNETNNSIYKDFFLNYIDYYIDANGNFINPETKEITGYRSGELDSVCESKILFDALTMKSDYRYQLAIHKTYEELQKISIAKGTENYSHKETYQNQIWLDGMYMYVPFLARYAQMMNEASLFDLIKRQYMYIRQNMYDEVKGLYYHGHDTTKSIFWADSTTGNSKSFWLRSNGWFIVSLVDVLEYFPKGDHKNYLTDLLKEILEGIMQYKDEQTNMFYQLIDQGATAFLVEDSYWKGLGNDAYGYTSATIKNYLESSGSSMIAYATMKAARLGYISLDYKEIGTRIYEGIYAHSFNNGCLNDICITAGLGPEKNPYRDGTPAYYLAEPVGSNDAKGVGPFLMACIEYAKAKNQLK